MYTEYTMEDKTYIEKKSLAREKPMKSPRNRSFCNI